MTSGETKEYQELKDLRIDIDKRDDLKNNAEVVYKPTTMEADSSRNQKFQSLKPESPVDSKSSLFLYRTIIIASLLPFTAGIGFSWTSPVLPKLQGPDSPLNTPINASQVSIIAAILCVGAALGPFPFGYLADKIGRKKTLIAISLPMILALSILAFTSEVKMYYFARFIYGIGSGAVFTVMPMYIGEITEDHNRGKFTCVMGIFVALGLLYPFSIGPMLSVRTLCLSSLLPLQIFLIFFTLYGPECPPYLAKQKKYAEVTRILMDLRDQTETQVQKELGALQVSLQNQAQEKGGVAEIFRSKAPRKAFMVSAGLLIIQQFSGINAVIGFMENIFLATGSAVPSHVATTLVGVIQVLTVLVTTAVVDKLGRKFLLLSSIIGATISIVLLGFYFFMHKHKFEMLPYFWWLPIVCLVVYIVAFNLGLGPIPWTIVSELFSDNVKSSASALVSSTCFVVSFVVTMAFPIISEILGMAQSFWMFGVCCVIGLIFIHYVVPETKGRTLAEIQDILSK